MLPAGAKQDLMDKEDRLWAELYDLVRSLPVAEVGTPGYFEEGWSAKDLVAHIGCWLAEAAVVLERIRFGTYRPDEIDIDVMNQRFYEAMKDIPFDTVQAQATVARTRMRRAWEPAVDDDPDVERWVRKAGPEHYEEHLPRLREWVASLAT
jgi:Mycothiol maleylpyruvate isomerase N-terminal domain